MYSRYIPLFQHSNLGGARTQAKTQQEQHDTLTSQDTTCLYCRNAVLSSGSHSEPQYCTPTQNGHMPSPTSAQRQACRQAGATVTITIALYSLCEILMASKSQCLCNHAAQLHPSWYVPVHPTPQVACVVRLLSTHITASYKYEIELV